MKQRPICTIPKCTNGGLLFYCNQVICGDCYMKISKEQKKRAQEEMLKIGDIGG